MGYNIANIAGAVSQAESDNQRANLSDLQMRQGEVSLQQGQANLKQSQFTQSQQEALRAAMGAAQGADGSFNEKVAIDSLSKSAPELIPKLQEQSRTQSGQITSDKKEKIILLGRSAAPIIKNNGQGYDQWKVQAEGMFPGVKLPDTFDPKALQSFLDQSSALGPTTKLDEGQSEFDVNRNLVNIGPPSIKAATLAENQRLHDAQISHLQVNDQLTKSMSNTMSNNNGQIDLSKVSKGDMEAAYRYLQDGTLPPNMGRGMQGQAQSTYLRGIAAQINENNGINPQDVRSSQMAFKGSGASMSQLQRREAQIGSNVKNFDFNSQQVEELSKKVGRTGTPIINGWLNAGKRSVQGDPDISAFDVAVKTTVNEFAQIVGGTTQGATTEGEKQKAEKLLSAAQTPEQVMSVLHQMRIESKNRMKSFADQKQEILGNMRGSNLLTQPNQSGKVLKYNPQTGGFE